jgi:hypothetical protein
MKSDAVATSAGAPQSQKQQQAPRGASQKPAAPADSQSPKKGTVAPNGMRFS